MISKPFYTIVEYISPAAEMLRFYRRGSMRATFPSICPSVCLSHAGIVSKRRFLHYGSPTIVVFWRQISSRHSKRGPQTRVGLENSAIF